ncbi:hypothetical protein FRC01_008357, partial [Tulasnella sp. 417]
MSVNQTISAHRNKPTSESEGPAASTFTNLNDAGVVTTKRKATVALEPYDVGLACRAKRERRQSSAAASLKNEGDI